MQLYNGTKFTYNVGLSNVWVDHRFLYVSFIILWHHPSLAYHIHLYYYDNSFYKMDHFSQWISKGIASNLFKGHWCVIIQEKQILESIKEYINASVNNFYPSISAMISSLQYACTCCLVRLHLIVISIIIISLSGLHLIL